LFYVNVFKSAIEADPSDKVHIAAIRSLFDIFLVFGAHNEEFVEVCHCLMNVSCFVVLIVFIYLFNLFIYLFILFIYLFIFRIFCSFSRMARVYPMLYLKCFTNIWSMKMLLSEDLCAKDSSN
jgi:hypothetical protein